MTTKTKRKPTLDPVAVLEQIAGDENAPSTARVNAARALLALTAGAELETEVVDHISAAAVALLNKKGRRK